VDAISTKNINSLSTFIETEVKRFLTTNRITDANLKELDTRIHLEAFLREKKDAIALDRKEGNDLMDA